MIVYEVLIAVGGTDSLELLKDTRVDLAVTDIQMPKSDKKNFCKAIR